MCRTALHWACKRNHTSVVRFLIANGADINIKTFNDESVASLASSEEALLLLDCSLEEVAEKLMVESQGSLPIIPHYLKNPPFPYGEMVHQDLQSTTLDKNSSDHSHLQTSDGNEGGKWNTGCNKKTTEQDCSRSHIPLVLKLRVHGSKESDFIEVEISSFTYQALLEICAEELEVGVSRIVKIRKLPNILVRNNRDVQRMSSGQELEVVLL